MAHESTQIAPPRSALAPYGNFVFRYRNVLFPAVALVLVLSFKPVYPEGSAALDRILDAIALVLALLGQSVRAAVVGLAYIKRGGVNKRVYAEALVTEGIFAHCRNPLYVGNLLVILGLFMIHNNPWIYALGGGFVIVSYMAVVAAEERYLHDKFGREFADYCARVPRWLPDCRGLGETFCGMRFNWRRVLAKEYSSAASWMLIACGLYAYESLAYGGLAGAQHALAGSAIVAAVVLTATASIRVLKKTGHLRESTADSR